MNIPFVDLKEDYKLVKREIDAAIQKVFDRGIFATGPEGEKFEQEFKEYLKVKHCVLVNSGTDALILGIRALDLPYGSEVIIAANSFFATALGATENNLKPVFADSSQNDFGINLEDLKKKINSRTKAIIITHLYGQPEKIDEINSIIKKSGKKIYLIEDACQAHGATYKNKKVGTFGIFGAFSFYPTKNLGAYGDGGAIVTSDNKLSQKYQLLKNYGQKDKYKHETSGVNSRLDEIQAAILRVKLKYLDLQNEKRAKIASLYTKLLADLSAQIKTPQEFAQRQSVHHLYVIQTKKRDQLQKYLAKKGVATLIHYPIPLHLQKAFSYLKYKKGDLSTAEKIANEILSLPIYPQMTTDQVAYVSQQIKQFYKKN